ncbi:hypothetical protein PHYBLDRAFT_95507, partial [Phycomyces blakesleeanus NRRL 1555(-)]
RMSKTVALKSMKLFCKTLTAVFRDEYLRRPNQADTDWILAVGAKREFQEMLGSIDCMH